MNVTFPKQSINDTFLFCGVTKTGYIPYVAKKNQDRIILKNRLGANLDTHLFGVADGHGENGHKIASFISKHLAEFLEKQEYLTNTQHTQRAIIQAVNDLADYLALTKVKREFSGAVFNFGVLLNETLFVANVGDCKCFLVQVPEDVGSELEILPLSTSHTPENDEEADRIVEEGGRIKRKENDEDGPLRVYLNDMEVPGLTKTRTLGDEVAHTVGVNNTAQVIKHTIQHNDAFVVWGTSGLWHFLSEQDAADIIFANLEDIERAGKEVLKEAHKIWSEKEEIVEDLTITILKLNVEPIEEDDA